MIKLLSATQRLSLTAGATMWTTVGDEEAAVPRLAMADGPMGIASSRVDERDVGLLTPCPTALGASWDVALCARVGALVGSEAVRRSVDLVLAPNVNLARSPLAGRAFEYFSEDPLLAGTLAAAWAEGVQSTGTGAVAKHLVCNDNETDRDRLNVVVDERALREVYLLPFELCASAGVGGIMTAYNRVNGHWCSENHHVITTIVKRDWAYDGLVMSDWFATHSTAATLNAGLDLEMPGPPRFLGIKAEGAVSAGEVATARVDDAAERVLRAAQRFTGAKLTSVSGEEANDLLVEAAAAGFVLVRNEDGFLPLVPGRDRHIAVIGPNACAPCYQGGTFAKIAVAPDVIRPWDAIKAAYGPHARVEYEPGVDPQPRLPEMPVRPARDLGEGCRRGMTLDYFDGQGAHANRRASETRDSNSLVWFAGMHDDVATLDRPARILASGIFDVQVTGPHTFYLGATGPVRMMIDGREILARAEMVAASDVMGRLKSGDADEVALELVAGQSLQIEVEFSYDAARVQGLWYGIRRPDTPEAMRARAVHLARRADAVILIVGETADSSVESKDRPDTQLSAEQRTLIAEVTAANSRTAIIANVGHAFDSRWEEAGRALMVVWYPGQGFATALAEVLAGDREPGGRMPVSIARDESDYPVFAVQPDQFGDVDYAEGTLIGYRAIANPRHAFGAGRGYAAIDVVSAVLQRDPEVGATVQAIVANRSSRPGAEVLQVYRRAPELALVGFAKVVVAAGEECSVEIEIAQRQLQIWQGEWVNIAEPRLFLGRSATDVEIDFMLPPSG